MQTHHLPSGLRPSILVWSRRVFLAAALLLPLASMAAAQETSSGRWFKGTTHSHSFWSDGDEFPDMVVDWFKSRGYDFFSLTDHNSINQGTRWVQLNRERRPIPKEVFDKYVARFGKDWVETRGEGDKLEVRLRTFEEMHERFNEPGKFLLIRGNEISTGSSGKPSRCVHLNALNLQEFFKARNAPTVPETMRLNVVAAEKQAKKIGQPILTHINHPNFAGFSITARDLAEVPEVRFFEMCNNHDGVKHYGDDKHASVERLWDIANALRLIEKKIAPVYGIATDDSHNYHTKSPRSAAPGRGWIGVRAAKLETASLFDSMSRGDFYSSTGVELARLNYDPKKGTLHVAVVPKPGTNYVIDFIGTPADLKLPEDSALNETADIGKVLASRQGTWATYRLRKNDLYVRAHIRSDRPMVHPNSTGVQNEEAWTQPVGWEKHLPSGE